MLIVDPQILIYPNKTDILARSTLLLSCTGYGIPLPSIVWSIDGQMLSNNHSRFISWENTLTRGNHVFRSSYLQICGAAELDSGEYGCTAVTPEREHKIVFDVQVIAVPATLISIPGNLLGLWLLIRYLQY